MESAAAEWTRAGRFEQWSWWLEASAVGLLALWVVGLFTCTGPVNLAEAAPEIAVSVWPYYVAVCHFSLQFVVCLTLTFALSSFTMHREVRLGSMFGELIFVLRCRDATALMAIVGLISSAYYCWHALSAYHHVGAAGWFPGAAEPRILSHYMLWCVTAPMQWVIVTRLCTLATPAEVLRLATATAAVMMLGLLAAAGADVAVGGVLAPFQWHRLCIFLGILCSGVLFARVGAVHAEPTLRSTWHMGVAFLAFVWVAMPTTQFLRSAGYISPWSEQVLFTAFDVAAKTLVALTIASKSIVTQLSSVMFSIQIANASQDVILSVKHPGWQLVVPHSGVDVAVMEGLIGRPAKGLNFLEDMVGHEDQRQALLQAAEQADSRRGSTAQKICATLSLPNGSQVKAECLVSKCLYGFRQVSLALSAAEPEVEAGPYEELSEGTSAPSPCPDPRHATLAAAQAALTAATQQIVSKTERRLLLYENATPSEADVAACSVSSEHISELIRRAEDLLDSQPSRAGREPTPSSHSSEQLGEIIKRTEELLDSMAAMR